MTHTYTVKGMTCNGCKATVHALLSKLEGVDQIAIDLAKEEATIQMHHHVPTQQFKQALSPFPKFMIEEKGSMKMIKTPTISEEDNRTWLETYKPILLVFSYITGITLLLEASYGSFDLMRWMNQFMAGFFLVFSFFKLINLKGFAESYFSYDLIAQKWMGWGYIYAFIELALGIGYLVHFKPLVINGITFVVMSISISGVLKSVLNKRRIRCACLGAVFNLPMSTITIIEDALMIIMSLITIITILQ
ncbi:MAG TPA: cation transporter [Flavisolibacter sp.]|nr:cation transporter [Flavisolibacter sp.]